jgi:iron(III) transport system substrate-binding protein
MNIAYSVRKGIFNTVNKKHAITFYIRFKACSDRGIGYTCLVLFTLLIISLFGCNPSNNAHRVITLYTSVPVEIITEIETHFEEKHPRIDLQIFRAGTGEVMERVEKELATGQVGADLLLVADFTVAEDLKQRGVLLSYTPPQTDSWLPTLKDEDGTFFAARLLNMVVAYNTEKVTIPPTGYHALLASQHYGRVGHASPETSGAFLYFMGALLQNPDYGEGFFEGLSDNQPAIQTNTQTTERIATGELDIGITIDFTVREYLQAHPNSPLTFIYPERGVVMVPSPIMIFKQASNPEAAKVFEEFILSQEGHLILRDMAGTVPVRLDVKPPAGIESITQLKVLPVESAWILTNHDAILSTFHALYKE